MTVTTRPEIYADLVSQLSLDEKVSLLTGATMFTLAPQESIGLGELRLSDGPTGVRGLKFAGGRVVTLFPNATLLSAAWDTDTAYEVGRLLAEEAMVQELHVVLGPTINLHRSVLGGRLFEAYSEDPLLTGKLAAAYVRGLQDLGVGACLKHLVANESETDRNSMDSRLDEKTLRELYLLPFEIAIEESQPWSLMAAYNDVNGVAATEQVHVNNEIVKGEWGYDGLLMSDWFATKTTAPSANGGLDLVMPGPDGPWGAALVAAVQAGEVAESVVDDHLIRILRLADRTGALGELRTWPTDIPAPTSDVRRDQLTRLAAAGMTVLTNAGAEDGTGVLPLAPEQTVALIGRHAIATIGMGGGSAEVNAPYQISLVDGLTPLLATAPVVVDGVEVREKPLAARGDVLLNPETGEPGVKVEVFAADGTLLDTRHPETAKVLVGFDDNLPAAAARVEFTATTSLTGSVEVGGIGTAAWDVSIGSASTSLVTGGAGASVGSELLAPPYAVAPLEVPADQNRVHAVATLAESTADATMRSVFNLGLVLRPVADPVADVLARAAEAAASVDVAVVVVGLTAEQETEAVDKSTIALVGAQDALVSAVAAAARTTVVVVNSATPVLMPWADEVDAILWAGLPGQEAGHAIAAALLGTIEPAGRLVTTFPAADGAAPAWEVVPTDGALTYDEGTFIGHRGHFAGQAPAPAFWFGHGLGYSTWSYADATLTPGAGSPSVTVNVTNTGTRPSREVVQVYLAPATESEPVRLVGWSAVTLEPGASAAVAVETDARLWRRWDEPADAWGEPLTGGELLVARGLGDIQARLPLA
ncbi:MAG: glycosyl hydrolase [Friedmanniella sp.]|nr:glycosyl hydrolase [Friedmanniella sp.]